MDKNQTIRADKLFRLCEKAEFLLKQNGIRLKELSTESDLVKLVHELEIHQIELVLQNDELKQAREKAELAEKKYAELYDFAPSGYVTLTATGEILELNESAERLLGKKRSHLIKSNFGFLVSMETRTAFFGFLKNVYKNESRETCEIRLEPTNDSAKYIHIIGVISKTDPQKCLVNMVDVTKRKLDENELMKAKEKAQENERLKLAFLANMSHEIRTPMNGILGFTELLKTSDLTTKEMHRYIDIIEKSGIRMLNLLNDIISISKIESQQMELSVSDLNINEQVKSVYSFFKPEAEHKELLLTYKNKLPLKEAYIRTDHDKIFAVLTNLVKNAIKFTEKGSIELGYTVKGDFLEFYVKDSGQGIRDEQKDVIFERFRQGSQSAKRKYEGAGLGLSISKAYVEMLGGRIWVQNNADKNENSSGAKFLFTIPFVQVDKVNQPEAGDTKYEYIKSLSKKLNILVAEDDEFSKMLFTKMVEGYSKNLFYAKTGTEAVKLCRENPEIDLVLMDINMPEMNGYKATTEIRKFNKEVVIIAQTGHTFAENREKSIAAGCNDSFIKPIQSTELIKIITHHLGKQ